MITYLQVHQHVLDAVAVVAFLLVVATGFIVDRRVRPVCCWPVVGSCWRERWRDGRAWREGEPVVVIPKPAPGTEVFGHPVGPGNPASPQWDELGWDEQEELRHRAWDDLDPDAQADQLIAEWHYEPATDLPAGRVYMPRLAADRERTADVWDQWWGELDGLDRECLLVRRSVEREDRLWAALVQETRALCPLAAAA